MRSHGNVKSRHINGRPSLQQLRDGAGFLLSSSECSRKTGSAGCGRWRRAHCCEETAWISWGSVSRRDESQAEAGEGERDRHVGLGRAALAVAWSVGREGTVKATELSPSLPRVLPPGAGKALSLPASAAMRLVTVRVGPGAGRPPHHAV